MIHALQWSNTHLINVNQYNSHFIFEKCVTISPSYFIIQYISNILALINNSDLTLCLFCTELSEFCPFECINCN